MVFYAVFKSPQPRVAGTMASIHSVLETVLPAPSSSLTCDPSGIPDSCSVRVEALLAKGKQYEEGWADQLDEGQAYQFHLQEPKTQTTAKPDCL